MTEKEYWLKKAESYRKDLEDPDLDREWIERKIRVYTLLSEMDMLDLHCIFDSSALNNIYLGYIDLAISHAKDKHHFTDEQLEAIRQIRRECYFALEIHNAFEAEAFYLNS